jgi:tetratricopeptide (TPR) repeat protein
MGVALLVLALASALFAQSLTDASIRRSFESGEAAMRRSDLAAARADFDRVLQLRPNDVGAIVNLGVISMREKQWEPALAYFQKAKKLAPSVPGIDLNIGLVFYRQSKYTQAIEPLNSVLRAEPNSAQARYLLGLCYLFDSRYAESADALAPLWEQFKGDVGYLYSLAVAAGNSQKSGLEEQSLQKLLAVGKDSPLVHLLVGKGYLAREDFDGALREFNQAAASAPNLPLLHYNLGVVYRRKGDLERARAEFEEDHHLEPAVPYSLDELGTVWFAMGDNKKAEQNFSLALALDPRIGTSWFGLAKIYKQERRYPEALRALNKAGEIDPQSASVHYLRAQILTATGRNAQAETERAEVRKLKAQATDKIEQAVEKATYRDPRLASVP